MKHSFQLSLKEKMYWQRTGWLWRTAKAIRRKDVAVTLLQIRFVVFRQQRELENENFCQWRSTRVCEETPFSKSKHTRYGMNNCFSTTRLCRVSTISFNLSLISFYRGVMQYFSSNFEKRRSLLLSLRKNLFVPITMIFIGVNTVANIASFSDMKA